jgi:hypothetical protein
MPDFGFVGAAYEAPSIYQDAQECINWRPEIDMTKQPGERGIVALYPTPGLKLELQLPVEAPVRAMRALSGDQYLIAVCGPAVFSVTTGFVATQVGTLSTSQGPVSITDIIQTTDGLTAYLADGLDRYIWVAATNTFETLPPTDGPWRGADVVDNVDNYVIYNQPGTRNWAATDLGSAYSTEAYFGTKDGSPDSLVSLIVDRRQVYLLGDLTTEIWTDVGNVIAGIVSFPFQRVQGAGMQAGTNAPFSVARLGDGFAIVAKDNRGNSTIEIADGYVYKRFSTHAVEQSLGEYEVSDAIAYSYQIIGHEIYVVTFPSVGEYGITWAYDLATQQWHKWLSWDQSLATFKRHRSNCHALFANLNLVGDYENGKIYSLQNEVYTEDGAPIRRLRRAPHLTADLQRQYFDELQIQFQPGVGLSGVSGPAWLDAWVLATEDGEEMLTTEAGVPLAVSVVETLGADPQAMLRWSNDGGSTWSSEHWTSIGKQGQYRNRAIWRRLGFARDRVFEVAVTDPIKCVIVSANLKASVGDN